METFAKINRPLLCTCPHVFFIIYLWLVACPVSGQVTPSKQATKQDYKLWGELHVEGLSEDGKWTSYRMAYEDGQDTLYVVNAATKKKHSFPKGIFGIFGQDCFAAMTPEGLSFLDLKRGTQKLFADADLIRFSSVGKALAFLSGHDKHSLNLIDSNGNVLNRIDGVGEYVFDASKRRIAYCTASTAEKKVAIIDIDKPSISRTVYSIADTMFVEGLVWDKNGTSLAFFRNTSDGKKDIVFYDGRTNSTREFDSSTLPGYAIVSNPIYKLSLSDDLTKIFFACQPVETQPLESDRPQIWNSEDKLIYPFRFKSHDWYAVRAAVLFPETGSSRLIDSDERPKMMLAADGKHSLTWDYKKYEPQFTYSAPVDFYLTDLQNGEESLMLEMQSSAMQHIQPSFGGKYVAYFREGDWFVFDVEKRTHKNLTQSLGVLFHDELHDMPNEADAYGIAGWSEDDRTILLYDRYDIWQIDPRTGGAIRLTSGREKKISFRIWNCNDAQKSSASGYGWISPLAKPENGLVLQAKGDDGASGFFRWDKNKLKKLVYTDARIDEFNYQHGRYVYRKQRFDLSPEMIDDAGTPIAKSNTHQNRFLWGKAESISYRNRNGQELKGFLCYPAGFIKGKKYPMIVHVYQRQFRDFHTYVNPSLRHAEGFNVANYTTQGYFVLFPDIAFEIGKTGQSATDCTEAAVKEVLKKGIVNEKRIGLIGHSFGGYETDFIITQSPLFATAVAGAAATDLPSLNLGINWTWAQAEYRRVETGQWRMGVPISEDWKRYHENSPVAQAAKIAVPTLSWVGGKETNIDWHQSIAFYLALRRLGKEHIMLLYPEDGHVLTHPESQEDLSGKIEIWFGHFLKGEPAADWMKAK